MAVYTRYVLTVTVETPADRRPQLVECFVRFEQDLHGHEFRNTHSTMELAGVMIPVPVGKAAPTTTKKATRKKK